MANPTVSEQLAVGKVCVVPIDDYYLMAWSGTDDSHTLNLGTGATPAGIGSSGTAYAGNADAALGGPALAVMPNRGAAYIAWVNAGGQIQIVKATPGTAAVGTAPSWTCGDTWTIANSTAQSAPTVALGTQNGHLVLNVIWRDAGPGCLALAQLRIGFEDASLAFCSLGQACVGTPSLTIGVGGSYLAWASAVSGSAYNTLHLAHDPKGGVDFDYDNALSRAGASAAYGLVYIPVGPSSGYAVYSDTASNIVRYTQIDRNQAGVWVVNGAEEAFGTFKGAPPQGPANATLTSAVQNNVQASAVAVVWPGTYGNSPANSILFNAFTPVAVPLPVA